ncbi:hypothetical protein LOD99_610 [Oopsacas minuta]|uniref:EF-hand domain-containing protein n=1 Tax=Oopsacas minuta TaxID=111878 RepID=A0AAV7K9F0_9METZ|nr:hypothetical protein LOD99_610 [Oopsacas minuta]
MCINVYLCVFILTNSRLIKIKLDDLGARLFEGIKNNTILRSFDLSFNGFGNEGAAAIGDALKSNSTLTFLYLRSNHIHVAGATALGKGLESNDCLQHLDLGCNPFEAAGAMSIFSSLKKAGNSALQVVDLKDVRVSVEMKQQMNEVKASLSQLTVLHGDWAWEAAPTKPKPAPIMKLQAFLNAKGIKIVDLFKKFDVENTGNVETKEIHKTLKNMNLPLTNREISELVKSMDNTLAGTIEYQTYLESLESEKV